MAHTDFSFVNTAVVVGCISMAIVFLALPLPENEGLKKYRISLRFLAGAYLIMAILQFLVMVFNLAEVNLISIEGLVIASLQAPLFTFTLIALINPTFVNKRYLFTQLIPIPIILVFYFFAVIKWGDPLILTFAQLKLFAFQPTVMIRELYLVFYIYQLVYLTYIFKYQVRKYENEIDNYFADSYRLQLPGVRYSFYSALIVGIFALISCFIFSSLWIFIFTVAYSLFYLVFAVYYIQYPRTFKYIEPAILPEDLSTDKLVNYKKRITWEELKEQVMSEKYYLRAGITIEELAYNLKVGRTTLSTFINNEEGMNFNTWINLLRVEEAKRLLQNNPTYSLTQIAEMIGYSEPSNFSRQFKLITNESPSLWRQASQS